MFEKIAYILIISIILLGCKNDPVYISVSNRTSFDFDEVYLHVSDDSTKLGGIKSDSDTVFESRYKFDISGQDASYTIKTKTGNGATNNHYFGYISNGKYCLDYAFLVASDSSSSVLFSDCGIVYQTRTSGYK